MYGCGCTYWLHGPQGVQLRNATTPPPKTTTTTTNTNANTNTNSNTNSNTNNNNNSSNSNNNNNNKQQEKQQQATSSNSNSNNNIISEYHYVKMVTFMKNAHQRKNSDLVLCSVDRNMEKKNPTSSQS